MRRALFPIPKLLALLLVAAVLAGCTGSTPDRDPDGDSLTTDVEEEGWVIEVTGLTGIDRRSVTGDPGMRDTDGDGLSDGEEKARNSDPRDIDTDDDGLLDGQDRAGIEAALADEWRRAGILVINGTFLGELSVCPPDEAQLRPNVASSDLPLPDGLLDGEELRGWDITLRGETRHVTSDPCRPDTDGDGLLDDGEKRALTDPRSADTDHDGVSDALDGDPLWDLGLRFSDLNVTLTGSNTTRVRLVFASGAASADFAWPGNGTALLDVSDTSTKDALSASVIVRAEDLATGEQVALTDDPRGAILVFDLLALTVEGAEANDQTLRFGGADGTMSFEWSVARR